MIVCFEMLITVKIVMRIRILQDLKQPSCVCYCNIKNLNKRKICCDGYCGDISEINKPTKTRINLKNLLT